MSDSIEQRLPAIADHGSNLMPSVYGSMQRFEDAQRMAKSLAASSLVPRDYQNNTANTLIALELAQRTGSSPMAVMQNVHVIEGRPSWSSQFVIAALNSCGRFSPLRFRVEDVGERDAVHVSSWKDRNTGERRTKETKVRIHDMRCTAWARDRATGEELEGPTVSIHMAVLEGWYTKPGSKWQTMPDLMLRYRAAKFFGNLYAPDVLMGMHAADEVEDFADAPVQHVVRAVNDNLPKAEAPKAEKPAEQEVIEGEIVSAIEKPAEEPKQHPAAAAAAKRTRSQKPAEEATEQPKAQPQEQQKEPPTSEPTNTEPDYF